MIIKTTCPRDCYDTCGIEVEIESDKVIRVTGDKDHPYTRGSLCGKCELAYNGVFLDPKVRLSKPLRRLGIKGEGRFVEVSWDEALQSISAKLEKIAMIPLRFCMHIIQEPAPS
jgi:anaerobic selenocysteine-containing dehydrogenase